MMITNLILEKLNVKYDDILKKKHGNCPELTYGELVDRILQDKGSNPCYIIFKEMSKQTFNRTIRKVFPEVRLNGGRDTWFLHFCFIVDHKYCSKCDTILQLSAFSKDSSSVTKFGVASQCKSCKNLSQKGQYERYIDAHKRYYEKHKDSIRSRNALYRCERANRVVSWSELTEIRSFYKNCPEGYHVDHIIPLKGDFVSGLHVLSNLQYLPARENIAKGNKYTI